MGIFIAILLWPISPCQHRGLLLSVSTKRLCCRWPSNALFRSSQRNLSPQLTNFIGIGLIVSFQWWLPSFYSQHKWETDNDILGSSPLLSLTQRKNKIAEKEILTDRLVTAYNENVAFLLLIIRHTVAHSYYRQIITIDVGNVTDWRILIHISKNNISKVNGPHRVWAINYR